MSPYRPLRLLSLLILLVSIHHVQSQRFPFPDAAQDPTVRLPSTLPPFQRTTATNSFLQTTAQTTSTAIDAGPSSLPRAWNTPTSTPQPTASAGGCGVSCIVPVSVFGVIILGGVFSAVFFWARRRYKIRKGQPVDGQGGIPDVFYHNRPSNGSGASVRTSPSSGMTMLSHRAQDSGEQLPKLSLGSSDGLFHETPGVGRSSEYANRGAVPFRPSPLRPADATTAVLPVSAQSSHVPDPTDLPTLMQQLSQSRDKLDAATVAARNPATTTELMSNRMSLRDTTKPDARPPLPTHRIPDPRPVQKVEEPVVRVSTEQTPVPSFYSVPSAHRYSGEQAGRDAGPVHGFPSARVQQQQQQRRRSQPAYASLGVQPGARNPLPSDWMPPGMNDQLAYFFNTPNQQQQQQQQHGRHFTDPSATAQSTVAKSLHSTTSGSSSEVTNGSAETTVAAASPLSLSPSAGLRRQSSTGAWVPDQLVVPIGYLADGRPVFTVQGNYTSPTLQPLSGTDDTTPSPQLASP